ncbi:MAG: flagellar hook capping protein [Anaerolineae bacterium]|nr:flagellar hook capping protein [Anaerolineae bacterium]
MSDSPWAVAAAGLMAAAPKVHDDVHNVGGKHEQSMLNIDNQAFLKLLLAQLRNQDPLSPMQSEEFLSQLAELTTLEQMWRMNDSLQTFMSQQQLLQASAMIGHTVQAVDETGQTIEGIVQGAIVRNGVVSVDLGDRRVALTKIIAVR